MKRNTLLMAFFALGLGACAAAGDRRSVNAGGAAADGARLGIEAIHHVGIVVTNRSKAEAFYVGVLGLRRHPERASWFAIDDACALHLIPLGDATAREPAHHAYRHVALQVADLRAVLRHLLAHGQRVFQADFDGNERVLRSSEDALDFGTGTLFVRDPDGNLVEFLQLGHGIFRARAASSS